MYHCAACAGTPETEGHLESDSAQLNTAPNDSTVHMKMLALMALNISPSEPPEIKSNNPSMKGQNAAMQIANPSECLLSL